MDRTIQLFLKNQQGFWGPLSVRGLRERLSSTGYTEDTLVSLDGTKWFSAQKIEGIVRQRKQASSGPATDPRPEPLANQPVAALPVTKTHAAPTPAASVHAPGASEASGTAPTPDCVELAVASTAAQGSSSPAHPAASKPPPAPSDSKGTEYASSPAKTPGEHCAKAPTQDDAGGHPSPATPAGQAPGTPGDAPKKTPPPATKNTAQRNESRERLRTLLSRVQHASKRLPWVFPWSVGGVFFVSTALLIGLACGLLYLLPVAVSMDMFALAALLPCVLGGAAISHMAGNTLLRILTGINDKERRCLALHLPWRSTPAEWPRYLRKWMYTGDWLVENFGSDLLPYVRAFITGSAPENLESELDLWAELMSGTRTGSAGHDFEVGHSVREMACVQRLPSWAKDVMPGMTLRDLELQLGKAGREWATSLIRRAARRKKIFQHIDLQGDLHEVSFEFHFCEMDAGREGLLVIIRPRLDDRSLSYLDDSRSDELAAA